MTALKNNIVSTLFGAKGQVGVNRGVAEFHAGRPVLISGGGKTLLTLPVEGLDAERLAAFMELCAPVLPRLVITARRALALGLGATTPVAGLLFRAATRWHLYAAYGNAFETPTFNELSYRPDGSAGINAGLVPARSRNGEVGSKLKFDNGGEFDVALFQANTRHELAVFSSSGGRTTYHNIDRARRRGVEAKLELPLSEAWRFETAYTHLDATFRSDFGIPCAPPTQCVVDVPAGTRIPGVPKDFASAALRYRAGAGWNAGIEANAASATPVNDLNSEFAPGYATIDGVVGYAFTRGNAKISTFIRLNNIADRHYAGSVIVNESNGRYYEPAPGRNVFAGCTIRWGR